MNWQVYILLCSDESLYTGITTDIERRMAQHLDGTGAKYFRGRKPQRLVYLERGHDRSSVSRREAEIKRMQVNAKRRLIASPLLQTKTATRPKSGADKESAIEV
ncbi:GIY-YIG nuclease family protein [Geopsychrobacter electrodiphilus]|uniref:GIY-YIG nuclease family protein n=1 Tax=Geopsychrobacter electrodiphilus TaxID=225196 RepID=UPI00037E6266|nr:GIY-YIG nuclease family protein [Geopsychrobacter electrodiphilus]